MTKRYAQRLMIGAYGEVKLKHRELGKIFIRRGIENFTGASYYCKTYMKYDNWTLRDIDKALAFNKLITL